MQPLSALGIAALLLATSVSQVAAHSLEHLETEMLNQEAYFQPVGKDAPDFALENAEGQTVGLGDLKGTVLVLHFIYNSCPDVCPLHADRIAEIQAMINQTPMREQVRFLTVTTDPARDTPEVMSEFGSAHGLDRANWTFLTTRRDQPEDATRQLAESFGHQFMQTEDGYQAHGVVTHIIDRDGRWRANFHGLDFDPTNLVVFVNALVNDVHEPGSHDGLGFWDQLEAWF